MPQPTQSYANHARYLPAWHFFAMPILLVNVGVAIGRLARSPSGGAAWDVAVAAALLVGVVAARVMALTAQDRVIRLEERHRLQRLAPPDFQPLIDQLTTKQLVALRFASDGEVVELARLALDGKLPDPKSIKLAIRDWRADYRRV